MKTQLGEGSRSTKSLSGEMAVAAAFVYAFLLLTGAAQVAYSATNIEPPGTLFLLYLGLLTAVWYWLKKDSQRYGIRWVWDMGLFLWIAWPLILPYYLLKTRRARAVLIGLAAIGAFLVGALIAVLVSKPKRP